MSGAPGADVAARVAGVLALVLERDRAAGELADLRGEGAADVEAALAALEAAGLVERAGSTWRAGPAVLACARRSADLTVLVELAGPVLRRLAGESGETANLIVAREAATEALAQADGSHLLGATNWVGRELPLHCTAAGKVFLALGAAELPADALAAPTPATIADRGRLAAELDSVRELGYATLIDELEPGLSAVAAPVRDPQGTVIAALAVSGATLRLPQARLRVLGRVTVEQAQALSSSLAGAQAGA